MIVAAQRDATGSYAGGFAILVGLAVVGALAVSFLRKGPARARNAENLVEPRRTS
jgi:hypothetical protein